MRPTAVSGANRFDLSSIMSTKRVKGEIILAHPRGFCAGVRRALDIVNTALNDLSPPIYVFNEIVHNDYVVRELRERGVKFVDNLDEIPSGSSVIFSAHGVSPQIESEAQRRELRMIDATCPLVKKIHVKAEAFQRHGDMVILIGHQNHPEIIGTLGRSGKNAQVVETIEDVANLARLKNGQKAIWLSQTTLCRNDIEPIITALEKRFPEITSGGGICYATDQRQNAVKELCKICQFILIIGSSKSSNSNRLYELAVRNGVSAQLINDPSEIKSDLLPESGNIGITAGASAPEILVTKTIEFLKSAGWKKVRKLGSGEEKISFN